MINHLFEFKNKILITIQILIKKITINHLSIEKFDITQEKSILVYFTSNETNKIYIKNIEWVFLNKKILRAFNNKDATKIGCMYAKYVFNFKEQKE